jgi:hypothetical protein
MGIHAILTYRILVTAKKPGLPGQPCGDEPKDNDQQVDPDLSVHLCLHALGVRSSRAIHDAGDNLEHLSELGQCQFTKIFGAGFYGQKGR